MSETSRRARSAAPWFIAVICLIVGYIIGAVTRTPPSSAQHSAAPTPAFPANQWIYPGSTIKSMSGGGGGSSSSSSQLKEPFPGAGVFGASETVSHIKSSGEANLEIRTSPDSIEQVYTYYAKAINKLSPQCRVPTIFVAVTTSSGGGGISHTWNYSVNIDIDRATGAKRAVIAYNLDDSYVTLFLERIKSEPFTRITTETITAPTETVITQRNPPMLPGYGR